MLARPWVVIAQPFLIISFSSTIFFSDPTIDEDIASVRSAFSENP
jgi:hypothetical protein